MLHFRGDQRLDLAKHRPVLPGGSNDPKLQRGMMWFDYLVISPPILQLGWHRRIKRLCCLSLCIVSGCTGAMAACLAAAAKQVTINTQLSRHGPRS